MKRIFYFNIIYSCNSRCVYCYSHNTWRNTLPKSEISVDEFFSYLEKYRLCENDRVILNGGEPLLHSKFDEILSRLNAYRCEVLVYTNGRLLNKLNPELLNENDRFVIPFHGDEEIHDRITGVAGSYRETCHGLSRLKSARCRTDIKLIVNNEILASDSAGKKTIEMMENDICFNNALHITKMAYTPIAKQNGCSPVSNEHAADYIRILFEHFRQKGYVIKFFDTCIKKLFHPELMQPEKYTEEIAVYFKDMGHFREIALGKTFTEECSKCGHRDFCKSAVDEYLALEYFNHRFYENLE